MIGQEDYFISESVGLASESPHRRTDCKKFVNRHTPSSSYDFSMAPSILQELARENSFAQSSSVATNMNDIGEEPTRDNKSHASLNAIQLATIIFYSVSGGPFGVEESVRAAGYYYTLIGFAVAPFVFSLPECLMTVELSAGGFKSSAGGAAWVEEAFGSQAGFIAGFLR